MENRHREQKTFWNSLLHWELFWIGICALPVLAPDGLLPIRWHPLAVGGLFLFWPIRWLAWRSRQSKPNRWIMPLASPASLTIICLVLWIVLLLTISPDRSTSWVVVGYLCVGVALCVALINSPSLNREPLIAAHILLLLGAAFAVAAPVLADWQDRSRLIALPLYDWFAAIPFQSPETMHSNVLAGVLLVCFPYGFAFFVAPNRMPPMVSNKATPRTLLARSWPRLWYGVITILLGSALLVTQSRGAIFAMATTTMVIMALRMRHMLIALGVLALAMLFGAYWGITRLSAVEIVTTNLLEGLYGRVEIWHRSLQALGDFGLTGIGFGTFTSTLPLLYPLRVRVTDFPHAHNLLLQIGLDTGIPGLILFLALWITVAVIGGSLVARDRAIRRKAEFGVSSSPEVSSVHQRQSMSRHDLPIWALGASLVGVMTALMIHGLIDAVLWNTKTAWVPWVSLALGNVLARTCCLPETSL